MLRSRTSRVFALLVAASLAANAAAVIFTWTGDGADSLWKTCGNWNPDGDPDPCWPDNGDDVIYPVEAGGWGTIGLPTGNTIIDDLTVRENLTFDGDGGSATLKCDSATFVGGTGGITVTFSDDATITHE